MAREGARGHGAPLGPAEGAAVDAVLAALRPAADAPPEGEGAGAAGALAQLGHLLSDAFDAIRARLQALIQVEGPELAVADPAAGDAARGEGGIDLGFAPGELDDLLGRKRQLFLGYYSERAASERLREDGILDAIEARVRGPVDVVLDPPAGLLRVLRRGVEGEAALVVEVKARRVDHPGGPLPGATVSELAGARIPGLADAPPPPPLPPCRLLWIDWMMLQNPIAPTEGFRALPGQRYPGLGVGRDVLRVLKRAAWRLGCDGVAATPMYYHNAVMYHRQFAFIDPRAEGLFLALCRDLEDAGMRAAAWAVEERRVACPATGVRVRWHGLAMLFPLSEALRAYILDEAYVRTAARVLAAVRFEVVPGGGAASGGAAPAASAATGSLADPTPGAGAGPSRD